MFAKIKSLFPPKSRGTDDATAHKSQGDEHLKADRIDAAAGCYRRALSISPDYVDACVGLGFALSEQKEYGEAEQYLRHALSVDQSNADAYYILGRIAKDRGDRTGSIEHFSRALDSKPDFEHAYHELFASLLQSGEIGKAKDVLHRALTAYPESAEFHSCLGNALRSENDYDNAAASYRKALSLQPASAELHKSLADTLRMSGQLDLAAASYQKALWFRPDFVDAHSELGSLLRMQGKLDQALNCCERAVELNPEHTIAQMVLGNVLESLGRVDEALACYRRAVALAPDFAPAHHQLGTVLVARGEIAEGVACYEQAVKLDPDHPVKYLVAALSGGDSERAPSDYVEQLFDAYAEKFDSHLVQVLGYSVPEKLAAILRPHFDANGEKWTIVDLGCGTGLSGAPIKPFARHLIGVDLSSKMLDKARERGLYDRLEQLDLLTMMQGEPASSYDVVFAADVFVYLGKLDDLVNQARRLLRPGGLFAFSVESLEALSEEGAPTEDRDYRLNATARYAHSSRYLMAMASREGFDVLSTTGTQSRLEGGKPVQGYLVLWRRSA